MSLAKLSRCVAGNARFLHSLNDLFWFRNSFLGAQLLLGGVVSQDAFTNSDERRWAKRNNVVVERGNIFSNVDNQAFEISMLVKSLWIFGHFFFLEILNRETGFSYPFCDDLVDGSDTALFFFYKKSRATCVYSTLFSSSHIFPSKVC